MHKEVKPLARACERAGYDVIRCRDHYKVRRAGKTVTVLPARPDRGGHRWFLNKRSELRRLGIAA